ncbi:MAG TPA: Replication protein O [Pseudogracilibacillus sp.]|nr:Replication protein O [Pseudogracilibacillus sp.]
MQKGWIKLDRKIRGHWLYRERRVFSKYEAWIDLLMSVNFVDNKFLFDGVLTEVPRGSMITSLRMLADEWRWSITKVKNFLVLLESDQMIRLEIDTKKTVISIVGYEKYEDVKDTEVTEEEQQNNSEMTKRKQQNNNEMTEKETKKNVKNLENVKNVKKEKNKQKRSFSYTFENLDMHLAKIMFEKMLKNNPSYRAPDFERWAQDIYLMRKRDQRTEEQIRFLINWTQTNTFWKAKILSPNQLREKFSSLSIQVKKEQEAKRRILASEASFAR